MPSVTLGDNATAFLLRQNNVQIRDRLNTLTQELSSGKKADLTKALGDTSMLRGVDRQLSLAQAQNRNATEVGQRLAAMQTYLGSIDTERAALLDAVVTVSPESTTDQLRSAAAAGRQGFDAVVNTLNTRFGGQSLFSGNAVNEQPLNRSDTMLATLRAVIAGAPDAATAITRINDWFDGPGGFETLGYISNETGPATRRIDPATTITIEAKADDPALRDLMKATAITALADDATLTFTNRERAAMLADASTRLLSNAQPLTELRARLGQAEALADTAAARLSAQATTLAMMRNDMDRADPFETASALQDVQTQLETHYTVTARLSRLSLAEYLR